MCAEDNSSMSDANEFLSDANAMQVLIIPSSDKVALGDVLNITYFVINNGQHSSMKNVSLLIDEIGPIQLNVSGLLLGQSAVGNESILVGDENLPGPIIRTAKAKAENTLGENVSADNSTSIRVITKGPTQ